MTTGLLDRPQVVLVIHGRGAIHEWTSMQETAKDHASSQARRMAAIIDAGLARCWPAMAKAVP